MPEIIVDAALSQQLASAEGVLPICDASGKVLGIFQPFHQPSSPEDARHLSPLDDAELQRRQAEPGGRPLREIWSDLERRADS